MDNRRNGEHHPENRGDPNSEDKTNNGLSDGRRNPGSNHGSADEKEGDGRRNGSKSGS